MLEEKVKQLSKKGEIHPKYLENQPEIKPVNGDISEEEASEAAAQLQEEWRKKKKGESKIIRPEG